MFCPVCRSEYRPGFERCATCDVELVAELSSGSEPRSRPAQGAACSQRVMDYCGFLGLDEAREARDRLRKSGIRSEIVIREPVGFDPSMSVGEEYWLRVMLSDREAVVTILGYDTAEESPDSEGLACSDCGRPVGAEETFCPHCGARFD